ncbi:ubiquitin-like protein ISG15 [Ambystoma mexicanum]|uniref:ubiquitin-like protein ISG15 n=1 Tax=Ambystoma mexicanum TaxID=8296 RepID=UPI0037E90E29
MQLNVKFLTGAVYTLDANPSMAVSTLKAEVARKTGVPAHQQKLGSQKNGYVELQDTARLSEYNLSLGDTLLLVVKEDASFEVFLMTDKGRKSPYTIKPSELVSEFKGRIYEKEKVQVSQFWLSYNSKQLEDRQKLGEYNIAPGGTIYMNLRLRGG